MGVGNLFKVVFPSPVEGGPAELVSGGKGSTALESEAPRSRTVEVGGGLAAHCALYMFPFLIQSILRVGTSLPQNDTVTAYHFCLF